MDTTPANSCSPRAAQRRARVLHPQARLAAVLGAREPMLACEELALRARLDLDHGREREAALQVLVALDAALAELPRTHRPPRWRRVCASCAGNATPSRAAGAGGAERTPVPRRARDRGHFTVARIEAALRARAVANA